MRNINRPSQETASQSTSPRKNMLGAAALSAALALGGGVKEAQADMPVNSTDAHNRYTPTLIDTTQQRVLRVQESQSPYSVDVAAVNHGRETGIAGAVTYSDGRVGVKLAADVSANERHLLAAAGYQFSENGYVILGGSTAQERHDLMNQRATLKGHSAFARLNLTNLSPAVRSVYLEAIGKYAQDATLGSSSHESITVRTEDLGNAIHEITRHTKTTETHSFDGRKQTTVRAGMELNVGKNGILEVNISQKFGFDNGTDAGARYTHYLPEQRARLSVEGNTDGRVAATATKALGRNVEGFVQAFTDTKHHGGNGVMAGVRYNWGGNGNYSRPTRAPEMMGDALRHQVNTTSNYAMNNIARYGEVKAHRNVEVTETVRDITPRLPDMQLEYDANYPALHTPYIIDNVVPDGWTAQITAVESIESDPQDKMYNEQSIVATLHNNQLHLQRIDTILYP